MNEAWKSEMTYKENKRLLNCIVFQNTFSSFPLVFHIKPEDPIVLHNQCEWI